jgi:glycosyltransferase involved in cell wall biosynthesis
LGQAQQTTFTADAAAEFYYRRVGFTAPVKIIPNGVDISIFHALSPSDRADLRARFALRRDQPVLLFVGRFSAENGLPVIRELAKLLPAWRFWIAGEGPVNPEKWFLPNLQVFRGRRDAALAELYQSADLLLLPGYRQGFPLAAQEAMACGLPLMCGPATASGSDFAKPYLWVANVDPASARRTAAIWATKLKAGRSILPLTESKTELSELAESYWEWPKIAGYYAETLQTMCKPTG